MYRLFTARNSYAMSSQAVLEEIGADYELKWVELFSDTPDPDFLAASPHARVPALVDETGTVCETGAIALYLAERHPEAELQIPPDDPRRARFLQWLFYLSSTLQPDVIIQFHPELTFGDEERQSALLAASMARLARLLKTLDEALDPGPYFFGDQLTIVDLCLVAQAVWPEIYPGSIGDYPNLRRLVERVSARPAVQRVLAQHGADGFPDQGRRGRAS